MNTTIEDILTNSEVRSNAAVEASLSQDISAGVPWWDAA